MLAIVDRVKRGRDTGPLVVAALALVCGGGWAGSGGRAFAAPPEAPVAAAPVSRAARPQDPADLANGRTLYVAHCGRCHGMDGGGGEGPPLAVPELQEAQNAEELRGLIRSGLPGTPMPGFWQITENDVRDIAAHVMSLGRTEVAAADLPGDPEEGAALYASMDCSSCHVIDGAGGTLGPVLTTIGRQRGIEHLREALLDPGAKLPENPDPGAAGSIYLLITVRTRDGRRIAGTRVNEDSFTVQIRDEEDIFHSLRKEEIVALDKRFGESLMPSYADRLNEDGINAMVAYLATLRGDS